MNEFVLGGYKYFCVFRYESGLYNNKGCPDALLVDGLDVWATNIAIGDVDANQEGNEILIGTWEMENINNDPPFSPVPTNPRPTNRERGGRLHIFRYTAGGYHIYPEMAAAGLWTTPRDLSVFAIEIQKSLLGKSNKVLSQIAVCATSSPP